jgi:hypothetical protein
LDTGYGKHGAFHFLEDSGTGDRLNFVVLYDDFGKIVSIFENKYKKEVFVDGLDPFERDLEFVEFFAKLHKTGWKH